MTHGARTRVVAAYAAAFFLFACTSSHADEIWPETLYKKLSDEAAEKFVRNGGSREVWHGGMAEVDDDGNRVGLVFWAGPSKEEGLVASCFDDTATDDPEIVVYFGSNVFEGRSPTRRSVSFIYDSDEPKKATWFVIEPSNGGIYLDKDGDRHLRSMISGRELSVTTWRDSDNVAISHTYSLIGFTKEFAKACNWHPNYNKWIGSKNKSAAAASTVSEVSIADKVLASAKREYPDDSRMQQFVYRKQMSSFDYMSSVTDQELKEFARREYSDDYAMQQFVYDKQAAAKRYMQSVSDAEIKDFSVREYSIDYSMQKFTYDKQVAAKEYMKNAENLQAKNKAIREYPNDYSMQKYVYERLAY